MKATATGSGIGSAFLRVLGVSDDPPEVVTPDVEDGSFDIPLDDDEEVLGQRYDAEADVLIVATSHGRKLVIGPDGSVTVLSGPPITPRD